MIRFRYLENEKILDWNTIVSFMKRNIEVLHACQQGHEEYEDNLGWLDVEKWAGRKWLDHARAIAEEIRSIADCLVIIGVGGSNNSARAVIEALDPDPGMRIVYAGNTLSPYTLGRMLDLLEGRSVVVDCIAKNFETLEPGASFRVLRRYLADRYGLEEARRRIFCTGTVGSRFEELSARQGYAFIPFPEDIGGRYTALSPVHLIPLAVAGADIEAYAKGAADMMRRLRNSSLEENEAFLYASIRNLLYERGYRVEILSSFEPRLRSFFSWWQQLFAESEGKEGKGILPVCGEFSEQLHSLGQFIQEGSCIHFETFLKVGEQQASLFLEGDGVEDGFSYLDGKDFHEVNDLAYKATVKAHGAVLPVMELCMDRIDAYHLGALFYFFEFACYISGELSGINPFDQPGVEAYKKLMFDFLGRGCGRN